MQATEGEGGCAVPFFSSVVVCLLADSSSCEAVTASARGVTFPPLTFWIHHPMSIVCDP